MPLDPGRSSRDAVLHTVLLLGAGHGRRMGGPKLFSEHAGRSFTARVLARCAESASPVTITVDPAHRDRLKVLLATLHRAGPLPPLRLVPADGTLDMLRSVQTGLDSVVPYPARTDHRAAMWPDGFWLWPVDAPFLSAAGWARARAEAEAHPEAVLKLRWRDAEGQEHTGHPVRFPAWAVSPILRGRWPDGLLGFLKTVPPERVHLLPLPGEVLRDFDTPEALAALEGDPG